MRLDALLVHSQVSGQGWGDLQKGDIVDCQRSVDEPVLLCIEGKPAYWAKLGLANGRRAVQILSAVE
jgi:flagellar motor switch protein FliM